MKALAVLIILFVVLQLSAQERVTVIADFEDTTITFGSYANQDVDPGGWALNQNTVYEGSYSLQLTGNTWKTLEITPVVVDSGDVWQIAVFCQSLGEIQGIGFIDSTTTDTTRVLFYSFFGSELLSIDEWVTHNQGAFNQNTWNLLNMPVAADFLARFDFLPTFSSVVFVNDRDNDNYAEVYYDYLADVTDDLPMAPEVSVSYTIGRHYGHGRNERVMIQFQSTVNDTDSVNLSYHWQFGDGITSTDANPVHDYNLFDNHSYTVLLEVVDDTGLWGWATTSVDMDIGPTSFPLTMNFVGDIMLARRYEDWNGIIPTLGVNAIFDPTLPWLGNVADITVANLECCFTNSNNGHPTKSVVFKSDPANLSGLTHAGIDIVCLANNHTLDYMEQGLIDTQVGLDQEGILYSGGGLNSYEAYLPQYINQKGVNIAFLRSCDRTGQYNNAQPYLQAAYDKAGFALMTPFYVQRQIEEVQNKADIIIAELHCGSEYSTRPGAGYDKANDDMLDDELLEDENYAPLLDVPQMWDIEHRHHIIDAGADLIVCHHPHIIQGMEMYNGKLIAHSLGNFIFDLNYPETCPTLILNTEIDERGIYRYTITPCYLDDYIPQRAWGELGLHILDYLAQKSKDLNTDLTIDRTNIIAEVIIDSTEWDPQVINQQFDITLHDDSGNYVSQPAKLLNIGYISSIDDITPSTDVYYRLGRELVWYGNMEDEGCTLWNRNSNYEDYTNQESVEGLRSMHHQNWTGNDGITTNLEERVRVYNDSTRHTIHGWMKTLNAAEAEIYVRYYTGRTSGTNVGQFNVGTNLNGTHDWAYYWGDYSVPNNGNYYDLRVFSRHTDTNGEAWFDNVGIIEWTDWIPASQIGNINFPNDYYYIQIASDQNLPTVHVSYNETRFVEHIVDGNGASAPPAFASLGQNYPNPFNPVTSISYSIAHEADVSLNIYNIKGQRVKKLVNEHQLSGHYTAVWNGTNKRQQTVASGIYFYRLSVNGKTVNTRKCLLLK
ncbi:MAG: CapA family protein [Candidatus Cloacimonetes bacterium]|nr:CapA family protein [Candidatus Cloacimonadota bacterium]